MLTFNTTKKSNINEILSVTQDIMQTAINPLEWRKEVERVKDQLNYKIAGSSSIVYENEAEESNIRRLNILDSAKVVWEF